MRQADINRVRKAGEHLKAATTLLSNIKWENVSGTEDLLMILSKKAIAEAGDTLEHILRIQEEEEEG